MSLPFADDRFDPDGAFHVPAQRSSHASQRAAAKLKASGVQGEKARRVLDVFRKAGAHGATDSDVERETGLPRQSVCSLRWSARKRGLIEAIGERPGPFGFDQTVHRITEKGRQA